MDIPCPPTVIEYVQATEFSSSKAASVFEWLEDNATLECQVSMFVHVAKQMSANTNSSVANNICAYATEYAHLFTDDDVTTLRKAYVVLPYVADYAENYFLGLRNNHIDIRKDIASKIKEDWSFEVLKRSAQTWHYYIYLASFNTPGAYEALANKVASIKSGDEAYKFLEDIASLTTNDAKSILLNYINDKREITYTNDITILLGDRVKLLIENIF